MGFTPRDVNDMTIWEFCACLEGWRSKQGADEADGPPPMSDGALAAAGVVGFAEDV